MFSPTHSEQKGFTLIEMLVVAPIVILAIGAFLTVIISMTGEVLSSRASNTLSYDIQDALTRIDQDVKLSSTFLAQNSITLNATEQQGYNNDATNFTNIDGTSGTSLILNSVVTNDNPTSASAGVVYLANQPNACASSDVKLNKPLTMNIVYFVKDNALWRRTIMPSNLPSAPVTCSSPWQQASCATGYTPGNLCKTNDVKLVDGVTNNTFSISYFSNPSSTTPNTVVSTDPSAEVRNAAFTAIPTVNVSISSSQTVAGRTIERSASIRSTRLESNASFIAPTVADSTPSTPKITATYITPESAKFTWPISSGNNVTYTADYNIDGDPTSGPWTSAYVQSSNTSYTRQAIRGQVVNFRVKAVNSAAPSGTSYAYASVTIPLWNNLPMQNNWTNYQNTYAEAGFTKTNDGMVVVKGLIKRAGTMTVGEAVGVLPEGYRPQYGMSFQSVTSGGAANIYVYPTGEIIASTGSSEAWLSLSTIRFLAADTGYTWTNPTLLNSWTNRNNAPTYDPPNLGYTIDGIGRVHVRGVIANGTNADPGNIFSLPPAAQSSQYYFIPVRSGSGGINLVGVYPTTNSIVSKGIAVGTAYFLNFTYLPDTYTNWTTMSMSAGWVFYGSNFTTPQYTKSSDGMVTIKGLIKSGTTTAGTVIFTLPPGYRPAERQIYVAQATGAGFARVDILANGQIQIQSGFSATWTTLDGLAFMAEQ